MWSHSIDPKAFEAGVMRWDRKGEEDEDEEKLRNLSSLGLGWGRLGLRILAHVTGDA